jgi:hypothetical protein
MNKASILIVLYFTLQFILKKKEKEKRTHLINMQSLNCFASLLVIFYEPLRMIKLLNDTSKQPPI